MTATDPTATPAPDDASPAADPSPAPDAAPPVEAPPAAEPDPATVAPDPAPAPAVDAPAPPADPAAPAPDPAPPEPVNPAEAGYVAPDYEAPAPVVEEVVVEEVVLIEVDETSELEELLAAAEQRQISVPEGVDPGALLGVIRQVDAAAAASPDVAPQEVSDTYVEREQGYISPEYAEAQEKGYLGTNPDEQANEAYNAENAAAGTNPPVLPAGGGITQPGVA